MRELTRLLEVGGRDRRQRDLVVGDDRAAGIARQPRDAARVHRLLVTLAKAADAGAGQPTGGVRSLPLPTPECDSVIRPAASERTPAIHAATTSSSSPTTRVLVAPSASASSTAVRSSIACTGSRSAGIPAPAHSTTARCVRCSGYRSRALNTAASVASPDSTARTSRSRAAAVLRIHRSRSSAYRSAISRVSAPTNVKSHRAPSSIAVLAVVAEPRIGVDSLDEVGEERRLARVIATQQDVDADTATDEFVRERDRLGGRLGLPGRPPGQHHLDKQLQRCRVAGQRSRLEGVIGCDLRKLVGDGGGDLAGDHLPPVRVLDKRKHHVPQYAGRRWGVAHELRLTARGPEWPTFIAMSRSVLRPPAVAALTVALALAGCGAHGPPHPRRAARASPRVVAARPADVTVSINRHHALTPVPPSFLGLSTEYWTLPFDERHLRLFRRVISLIHVAGDAPLVLRIGGDSSDHTFYVPRLRRLPSWAFGLTPALISRTARVVRATRLRVILDLNLVTGTPELARAWVREAEAVLPPSSIIGFEIGNEPDLYGRGYWQQTIAREPFGRRVLPPDLGPAQYVTDFAQYGRAIQGDRRKATLLGPAVANPSARGGRLWINALLRGPHAGLRVVTAHRYPYTRCVFAGSPWYPTISRILSEDATAGMAASVRPAVRLAHAAGLPFRLTEFNSVTCGGVAGVSDSLATALWAPDAAFELMRTGAQGINLHAREYAVNDPFTFDRRGLHAHPLLYGLILFARTLGPDARLVRLRVHAPGFPHVKVWGVRIGRARLHLLVINKGPRGASVQLNAARIGSAVVQRLSAPAPGSEGGVRLAGQWLDRAGRWRGRRVAETAAARGGDVRFVVPRYSAALVSARLTTGALR